MIQLLSKLINATLSGGPLRLECVTEEEWQHCFELALQQQVLAMTFPTISTLPKEQRPGFLLWSKWMAYAQSTAEQLRHKQEVVRMMGEWLAEEGLSTLIVKGFSLAVLYPNPNLREFCDVDIYSGKDYEAVNACMERHGITIGKPDGHHVHLKIDGVSVEHHFAFGNSRLSGDMYGMEMILQQLAENDSRPTSMPGVCFPNAVFTTLFVCLHAYKHFMHEMIGLRHVVDWALALRQIPAEEVEELHKTNGIARWGRFADTLTAIAMHRLLLPKDWFPQREVVAASEIDLELEQRVWDDIISSRHTAHGRTSNHRRLNITRRTLQNRWKFEAFADMSAERFLWKEFVGLVRNR